MAYENDTDRMAGDLLNRLKESLSKPLPGTATSRSQAQPDEGSMLNTIKDFLNQSLPGTKPIPRPTASTPVGAAVSQPLGPAAAAPPVDWESMYRRQERERETMYGRQVREREDMRTRHEQEMVTMVGPKPVEAAPYFRPAPAAAAPKPSSRTAGIVPGKTIGNWTVETEGGPKTFQAVSESQAMREAQRYGLTPRSARLAGIYTFTDEDKQRMLSSFGVPGMRESMRAEFELAIKMGLIPETSEFEVLPNREWGYRLANSTDVRKGADLVRRRGL